MSTHDDFRTDEELEEIGFVRKENRVYSLMRDRDGKWRNGHYVVELDTPDQRVMRWVWDD